MNESTRKTGTAALLVLTALGLTALFWWPLWQGGGLVGGDVYSYYLPQKVFYADRLLAGEFPLWNNRAGHGYPLVAESQTGPFYPFHLLLYTTLDVNTAYNVNHLLHYTLAVLFAWMYARTIGLGGMASMLSAIVFTYAWFPARSCWEWAIIGGAWLPAALWCVERFIETRKWRFAIGLTLTLTMQMFAGHFNLAFITQLVLVVYIPARLWLAGHQETRSGTGSAGALNDASPPDALAKPVAHERRGRQSGGLCPGRQSGGLCPGRQIPHRFLKNSQRPLGRETACQAGRIFAVLVVAFGLSFCLSAVQLFATWELKQHSQRAAAGRHHNLAHGSIPPWYWSQIVRPWHWYANGSERDAQLRKSEPSLGAPTNQVEAHLYFGLMPLGLAILGCVALAWPVSSYPVSSYPASSYPVSSYPVSSYSVQVGRALAEPVAPERNRKRRLLIWLGLGLCAFVYTSGCMLPVTRHLPGFNFFQGPGRFGLVTTFAVALFCGNGYERLRNKPTIVTGLLVTALFAWAVGTIPINDAAVWGLLIVGITAGVLALPLISLERGFPMRRRVAVGLLTGCVLASTLVDLWIASRLVRYSEMVADAPIRHLDESPVREILARFGPEVRLFAPGANLPTLLGVAATPVYLTFGPAAYVDPKLTMPVQESPAQIEWLQRAGVTHVLSFKPLSTDLWPVEPLWRGFDPLLNPAWARYRSDEPLYLYRLRGSRGRAWWNDAGSESTATVTELNANRVIIEARSDDGGLLVLTDLMLPGWTVTVDGRPGQPVTFEGMSRVVDLTPGDHRVVWTYRPASLYWGGLVSIVALLLLAGIAHVRYWHPGRLGFLD